MTPYQLAKVIQMAGGIKSRKRIQKTLHLLQAAGCDLGLEYRLHHYGPYCAELAESLDSMGRNGLLVETSRETEVGTQYDYRFNEEYLPSLESFETTPTGALAKQSLERHAALLVRLCGTGARVLELASTIAEFYKLSSDWSEAHEKTAGFKGERVGSPLMTEAQTLAMAVMGEQHG